ncbi:type I secretion system permease/ATPase [Minwuia sp.]|uniref:type I secretion system permease/ATPase n=1 Tax=Minwuia sp. TaxID=2493630 RepID=UPI003A917984
MEQTRSVFVKSFVVIGVFSVCTSLLMLAGPLYMLQIYDRVINTGNVDTLIAISAMLVLALGVFALLEGLRTLVAQRVGVWLDRKLFGPALAGGIANALNGEAASAQGLRDVTAVRSYLASPAIFPLFDAPIAPFFLLILFIMHPLLGIIATAGAVILFLIALANELVTRKALQQASGASSKTFNAADAAVRNADVIAAMAMMPALARRIDDSAERWRMLQLRAGGRSGMLGASAKGLRLLLQSVILGAGAWLVLRGELTPGMMIAASIMMSRALAPVEQAISAWQGLVNAQAAWRRLKDLLANRPALGEGTHLPEPKGELVADGVIYQPKGAAEPILRGISFRIPAGTAVGIIGPTGSGKTTLARAIVGTRMPQRGAIRLDNADVSVWDPLDRGRHVGYLPQDIELFDGTVKENIARLGEAEDAEVIEAAQLAGVHDMILKLPQAYETPIGERGAALSGGQRQRIGLARAVFRRPRLIVLDEPNANLDAEGEDALVKAVTDLKQAGHTILLISHKPSLLSAVDMIMVMQNGQVSDFGDAKEVMAKFGTAAQKPAIRQVHPAEPKP